MRRLGSLLRGRPRDERGATAVVVVVSLTAILGSAVLSIDAGSVWHTRRNLVTDTDAAALAAARSLDAAGERACGAAARTSARSEASTLVGLNDENAALTGFAVTPAPGRCTSGKVRVDARLDAPLSFAGVFGVDDVSVASSSIAQWGPLSAASGLRPIGICDKSEHFVEWGRYLGGDEAQWGRGAGDRRGPNGEVIHRVEFQKGTSGCGSASGNWDWLDFNGGAQPNGSEAISGWLRDGYGGVVALGDQATGVVKDCNSEEGGAQEFCEPKTGALGGSTEDALRYLRDNRIVFPILVYDRVVDRKDPKGCASQRWDGTGTNARFCHVAFLLVRVHGWDKVTGNDGAFEFEFLDEWWVGSIGRDPSGGRPTTHGVALCGGGYGTTIDDNCTG